MKLRVLAIVSSLCRIYIVYITNKILFDAAVIEQGFKNIEYYKQHIVIGAEFNGSNNEEVVNVMYSNLALHGAPISLNILMNALIKSAKGEQYSITTKNSPMQGFIQLSSLQTQSAVQNGIMWLFLFPLGKHVRIKLIFFKSKCF